MEKRLIMVVDPKTRKIESRGTELGHTDSAEIAFGVELPAWWRRTIAAFDGTDGLPSYFSYPPGFINHSGILPGTDIVVGNPYRLSFDDFTTLRILRDRFRVHVSVNGLSAWSPGESLGVYLVATTRTYQLLKLKPKSTAACIVSSPAYDDVGEWLK